MAARKGIAPERADEIRRLYEETTTPVAAVIAASGLSRMGFYDHARKAGWRRRGAGTARARAPAAASREPPAPADAPAAAPDRAALLTRIQASAERELMAVERIVATLAPGEQVKADDCSRILAQLSRIAVELAAVLETDPVNAPDAADDDPVPADIDEFRDTLARRIRAFVESRRSQGADRLPDHAEDALD